MPRIEDLRNFNEQLTLIGEEAAILSDRGHEPERPEPPGPEEVQAMLDRNALKVRKVAVTPPEPRKPASPSLDDLVSASLGGGGGGGEDFSDLFGDEESSTSQDIFADLFGTDEGSGEEGAEPEEEEEGEEEGIEAPNETEEFGETEESSPDVLGGLFEEGLIAPPPSNETTAEEEALLDDFLASFGEGMGVEEEEEASTEAPPPDEAVAPPGVQEEDALPAFSGDFGEPESLEEDFLNEESEEVLEPEQEESGQVVPPVSRVLPPAAPAPPAAEDLFGGAEEIDLADEEDFAAALESEFAGQDEYADFLGPEISAAEELEELEPLGALQREEAPQVQREQEEAETETDAEFDSDLGKEFLAEDFSSQELGTEFLAEELRSQEEESAGGSEDFDFDAGFDQDLSADVADDDQIPENLFDMGDDVSFDQEASTDEDFGAPAADPFAQDLDADFGSLEEGEGLADDFSMGDFGAEFGILDDKEFVPAAGVAAVEGGEELASLAPTDQLADLALSREDFEALKRTMDQLPLNVKSAAAELVYEATSPPEDLKLLLDALVRAEAPGKIASIISRMSGKRIVVPKGYEKLSGRAFEEEQSSFVYQFREKIWPALRTAALVVAASALLVYLGYNYMYRPLHANNLYGQGLAAIADGQYPRGNALFEQAYAVWPDTKRFFDYVAAFVEEREYHLAQEKYRQLLTVDPLHRRGILEYANFAAFTLRDYQTGVDTLERLLGPSKNDYDPLLAQGDIYMEWARYTQAGEVQDERYDFARSAYVRLSSIHGQTDPILFRLLLYFVRTGDLIRAFKLQQVFDADPKANIEPRIYAELAGFYVDTWFSGQTSPILPGEDADLIPSGFGPDLMDEAWDLLTLSLEKDSQIAEVHYHLARIFGERDQFDQERRALLSARALYSRIREERPPTQFELAQEIDTIARIGESNERSGNLITAEQEYRNAMALYERGRENLQLGPGHNYGRIYARLGNLYYYEGNDYQAAYDFFSKALENGYGQGNRPNLPVLVRDLEYKMGFVRYAQGGQEGYRDALDFFLSSEGATASNNPNLIYAKANTFFQLGNHQAASAQYQRLISRLVEQRERIATFLVQEDSAHRGLVDFLIRAYNNLGVSIYQQSRSAGAERTRRQVEAQFYLSKGAELAENVARDEETAIRADTRNLAFLNLRSVLVPGFEGEVLIDPDLPKDLDALVF